MAGTDGNADPGFVQEVKVQTDTSLVSILVAAFIFIISLAWNDAFKSFFNTATPWLKRYGPWAYAISITVIGFACIQFLYNNKFVNNVKKSVNDIETSMMDREQENDDNKIESFSLY